MKKIICVIILILMIAFSSCSAINEGILMPNIKTDRVFENDMWLVVEDQLINKIDGIVYWLKPNDDATMPAGVMQLYYGGTVVYDCEFEESTIKLHTILTDCSVYYECVFTFDYEGNETDRFYVGGPFSREEALALYQEKTHDVETFSFYVLDGGYGYISNRYKSVAKKDTSAEKQAILNFSENIYNEQADEKYYMIDGLAKPVGDEIWFSISGSNRLDSVKAEPLISGICESRIVAYNRETKEFRTVFKYDEKWVQIIDFDENGAYILDSNGEFGCVNFETKKLTKIYEFPNIDSIVINDKYFCVKYVRNGRNCFVYEKGGAVIANDSSLD